MPSFTVQSPNIRDSGPLVDVQIYLPAKLEEIILKEEAQKVEPIMLKAMIDTGASGTVIQEEFIKELNLSPIGVVKINTPSSNNVDCYQYLVKLLFPNNVMVDTVIIAAPLKGQHIQALIGRDILQHGVLVYTGYINQFTLSF